MLKYGVEYRQVCGVFRRFICSLLHAANLQIHVDGRRLPRPIGKSTEVDFRDLLAFFYANSAPKEIYMYYKEY